MTTTADAIFALARSAAEAVDMASSRSVCTRHDPEDGTEITDYVFEDGSVLAVSGRDYWAL